MSLDDELLKNIDDVQKELGFSGRSETIRAALKMLIEDRKSKKTLKGIIARKEKTPPITHDLLLLAELANIELSIEQAQLLSDVNAFNIRARYDDYKNSFYKRATVSYAKKYIEKVNKFKIWLKKQ